MQDWIQCADRRFSELKQRIIADRPALYATAFCHRAKQSVPIVFGVSPGYHAGILVIWVYAGELKACRVHSSALGSEWF